LMEVSVDNMEHSHWLEVPASLEELKKAAWAKAPKDTYIEFARLSHWSVTVDINLFIYLNDEAGFAAMNSAAHALSNVPGGELIELAAMFERERERARSLRLTWARVEQLARELHEFKLYTRVYNEYDLGFQVAHDKGELDGKSEADLAKIDFAALGKARMGDGAFTQYGFIGRYDAVMRDIKNGEKKEEKESAE
ncbi:hypothetical protein, partial [Pyramidobacter sp.]